MKSKAIQDHISIGSAESPQKLIKNKAIDEEYPDINLQENDKLNYLSSNLSSTELIGMHSNQLHRVVIPKLRYPYRKTTLKEDDFLQMRVTRQLLLQLRGSDEAPITTRASKKMKTSTDQEKWDTAGATTDMINFSAKFIMQNSDREKHLFFALDCNRYNIWVDRMTTGTAD